MNDVLKLRRQVAALSQRVNALTHQNAITRQRSFVAGRNHMATMTLGRLMAETLIFAAVGHEFGKKTGIEELERRDHLELAAALATPQTIEGVETEEISIELSEKGLLQWGKIVDAQFGDLANQGRKTRALTPNEILTDLQEFKHSDKTVNAWVETINPQTANLSLSTILAREGHRAKVWTVEKPAQNTPSTQHHEGMEL